MTAVAREQPCTCVAQTRGILMRVQYVIRPCRPCYLFCTHCMCLGCTAAVVSTEFSSSLEMMRGSNLWYNDGSAQRRCHQYVAETASPRPHTNTLRRLRHQQVARTASPRHDNSTLRRLLHQHIADNASPRHDNIDNSPVYFP